MSYTVVVCDMFSFANDPDHELEVPGFPTLETAIEYARRRLRGSVEEQREPGRSHEELRHLWRSFGEDCRVVGPEGVVYVASADLDDFIRAPATSEECDYLSLYESLLPEDFAVVCEWAAGTVPPPHHYEYRIALGGYEQPPSGTGKSEAPSTPRIRRGELTFWPDYPGPEVPTWTRSFPVRTSDELRLYALLQDGDLLAPYLSGDEQSPIGGETVVIDVTAQGLRRRISSTDLPSEQREFLVTEVMEAVRNTVPTYVWDEMETQRRAYHLDRATEG